MRKALPSVPLVLLLWLSPLPAAGASFSLSADSAVKVDAPSRLTFRVTNADGSEGLSRLTLRFPAGYRVAGGSAPAGWTLEQGAGETAEISFRTTDEARCTGAIPSRSTLVFDAEVIAPASRSVTPDQLVAAQAEQSCQGMAFDSPSTLPSWNRLGLEASLVAGPPLVGIGGVVTVTLTVSNLSTVELAEISTLLLPSGTGSVGPVEGPTPPTLTLAPGASGSVAWTAHATSAGTLAFGGQAVSQSVMAAPVRSDTLFVGDLDVSVSATPEQVSSGQDVQIQMIVTNRGPVRIANVVPSPLAFEGTATPSGPAGPSPGGVVGLEPRESTTFAWTAAIAGNPGDTYAFTGGATAEGAVLVSASVTSNRGTVGEQDAASAPQPDDGAPVPGGGADGTAAVATDSAVGGAGSAAPGASASLQFIGISQSGSQAAGTFFSGGALRTLRILVGWQNVGGAHSQRLEVVSPEGTLYQRFVAPFSGASSVETWLPVGGTWITDHFLFGSWRVDIFLDGEGSPVASGTFVLTQ